MKPKWLVLFFFIFAVAGGPGAAGESKQTPPHLTEQTHFSAEESGVTHPVVVPKDVIAILSKDETVQSVMESENTSSVNLPASWFSASAIHLSTAKRMDLIVVGEPPVSGGSVAIFWVFCSTPRGFELVLKAPVHNLIVKNTRWKGHRDIELISTTAVEISKVLCRFDGKRYAKYRMESKPL